jgi:uncharacterized protein with GYD domain
MRLFIDIFSNDEIISDSFDMKMCYNDVGCKVKSNYIVKGEDKVDIGCGNAFANPDAEEEAAGGNAVVKVLDVMESFDYQETSFDKASYGAYLKGYMGKVLKHLEEKKPDRVAAFKAGAKEMGTWIMSNFNDFTFYTPKSYDMDNSLILSYIDGEDLSPTFVYFMDGLRGEKC